MCVASVEVCMCVCVLYMCMYIYIYVTRFFKERVQIMVHHRTWQN